MELGTDGASVMTGKRTEVGARLRTSPSPFVIQVHCVAHRLALASGQAAGTVSMFKEYQQDVNAIYYFFQNSATRMSNLHLLQKVIEDCSIALQTVFSTRSLSFRGVVDAVRKSYVPLILALEENDSAASKGLLKRIKEGKFLLSTWFLCDALPILTKLQIFPAC